MMSGRDAAQSFAVSASTAFQALPASDPTGSTCSHMIGGSNQDVSLGDASDSARDKRRPAQSNAKAKAVIGLFYDYCAATDIPNKDHKGKSTDHWPLHEPLLFFHDRDRACHMLARSEEKLQSALHHLRRGDARFAPAAMSLEDTSLYQVEICRDLSTATYRIIDEDKWKRARPNIKPSSISNDIAKKWRGSQRVTVDIDEYYYTSKCTFATAFDTLVLANALAHY